MRTRPLLLGLTAVMATVAAVLWWLDRDPSSGARQAIPSASPAAAPTEPAPPPVVLPRVPTAASLVVLEPEPLPAPTVQLSFVTPLSIRVLRHDGRPAEHASVVAWTSPRTGDGDLIVENAVTNELGSVRFSGWSTPTRVAVGGVTYGLMRLDLDEGRGEHTLQAERGALLEGRVTVDGSQPGTPVRLTLGGDALPSSGWVPYKARQRLGWFFMYGRDVRVRSHRSEAGDTFFTDGAGRFLLSDLPDGWEGRIKWLQAYRGFEETSWSVSVRAPSTGLLIELFENPVIKGRVVDREGHPVPWPEVQYVLSYNVDTTLSSGFFGDERGYYEISMIRRSVTSGHLSFRGIAGQGVATLEFGAVPWTRDHWLADVELQPVRQLRFHVIDTEARPIPGAIAGIGLADASPCEPTDAEGMGVLYDVPLDTISIRVDSPTHRGVVVPWTPDLPEPIEVVLPAAANLTIRVRSSLEGTPEELTVRVISMQDIFESGDRIFGPSDLRRRLGDTRPSFRSSAGPGSVDRKGQPVPESAHYRVEFPDEIHITELKPGVPFSVELYDRTNALVVPRVDIVLSEGEQRVVDLVVDTLPVPFQCRVLDKQGAPIPDVSVSAHERDLWNGGSTIRGTTDANGLADLGLVYASRLDVWLNAEDRDGPPKQRVAVPPNGGMVTLVW